MAIDLGRLASQGRAHSISREWNQEELDALAALTTYGLSRLIAAEYIRNGIDSVEAYEKAVKKGVEPQKLEDIHAEAEIAVKKRVRKATE